MSFRGKRVVITAGGRGIARRAVERYLAAGARVLTADVDEAGLASAKAANPALLAMRADVSSESDVAMLFETAKRELGGLDILINAAGIGGAVGPVETFRFEDWRRCMGVNIDGPFLCCRAAIPMLKAAGRSSIVNFSSVSGLFGNRDRAPYVAAKWAVIGLTKTLAMELGPFGINVNAICPGPVEGKRMEEVLQGESRSKGKPPETLRAEYTQASSMREWITADDVVAMVMLVTSPEGHRISGQALTVDGHTESVA
jgi:NAD(P)-dependent dehydrogenase (short-subunit alcohol dehydrogenase family)